MKIFILLFYAILLKSILTNTIQKTFLCFSGEIVRSVILQNESLIHSLSDQIIEIIEQKQRKFNSFR